MRANVSIPGTQSGLGALLALEHVQQKKAAEGSEDSFVPDYFSVVPGLEVFFPGNEFATDDRADVYPINPVKTVATPWRADWANPKLDSEYFHHIEYAGGMYKRISEGFGRIMPIGNGGAYTIAEANVELWQHNSPVLLVAGTGRFADLAILALAHKDLWSGFIENQNLLSEKLAELAQALPDEADRSSVTASLKNSEVYRNQFALFLKAVLEKPELVETTTLANLEEKLVSILQATPGA